MAVKSIQDRCYLFLLTIAISAAVIEIVVPFLGIVAGLQGRELIAFFLLAATGLLGALIFLKAPRAGLVISAGHLALATACWFVFILNRHEEGILALPSILFAAITSCFLIQRSTRLRPSR